MQKEYGNLIHELSRGRILAVNAVLDNYSIEQLEELAVLDTNSYLGDTLYSIVMLHRKNKLDEQFLFCKENVEAMLSLDRLFKESCRKLKVEAESEFFRLLERKENNQATFFFSIGARLKIGTFKTSNSFLDCAHAVYDEDLFNFSVSPTRGLEEFQLLPVFDFDTNYATKLPDTDLLANCHIGFAFYHFYRESLFSLIDMLEINSIEVDLTPNTSFNLPLGV